MIMRVYIIILFLFLGINPASSQNNKSQRNEMTESSKIDESKRFKKKNIMKEVKNYYKALNFAKTDEIIRNAFKTYSEASSDPDLLGYEMYTQYQLYLNENKKIFLKQNADTAKFFSYIYNTYDYALKCDSVCSMPKQDGKTNKRYASDVNNRLFSLRNNLKSGGFYHMKKKNFKEALSFLKLYIKTMHLPVVYKNHVVAPDTDSIRVYSMALHAAYGAQQYKDVLSYRPIALKNKEKEEMIIEMSAQSAMLIGDTIFSIKLMNDGFEAFPDNEYFKANLIKYYHNQHNIQETIRILDRCIQTDSLAPKYWKLKGNEYYDIDSLDKAVNAYQHVVEIDKDDLDALTKLANIYLRKASQFYETSNLKIGAPYYEKNRKTLTSFFETAMVYYEKIRTLKPDDPVLWRNGLRETYYKLNKGKELQRLEYSK